MIPAGVAIDKILLNFSYGLARRRSRLRFSTPTIYLRKQKSTTRVHFSLSVIPAGVEPAIFWMRTKCPRPLDDGTMANLYIVPKFDFASSKS